MATMTGVAALSTAYDTIALTRSAFPRVAKENSANPDLGKYGSEYSRQHTSSMRDW